jgi:hypothetical protein
MYLTSCQVYAKITTLFFTAAFAFDAHAALGDNEQSISSLKSQLHTIQRESEAAQGLTVHILATPSTTIREYISPNGKIFAVTWKGLAKPDMATVLGGHYSEYLKEKTKRVQLRTKRPLKLETPNLVLKQAGHMRALKGLAYVPDLVPADINVETLP